MSWSLTRWPPLTPKAEIEGEMGAFHMGLQARLMSQALRKAYRHHRQVQNPSHIHQSNQDADRRFFRQPGNDHRRQGFEILLLGQNRSPESVSDKKGRRSYRQQGQSENSQKQSGAPFRTAEFDIIFNEGISYTGDILNLGEKYEIIKKSGASYSYEGTSLGRGYDSAKTFLLENPKVTKELETKIKEAAKQAVQGQSLNYQ